MDDAVKRQGPLAGVRGFDLTSMVIGAYAMQIMADDVINVEAQTMV